MKRRNARAGSALIEFAGSLILLSSLFTGIFQVGYTFFSYQRLVNSVRGAARYASLHSSPANDNSFVQAVRNLAVYDDPAPAAGAKPLVPGLATSNVDVIVTVKTATVSIRGFTLDSLFSRVQLEGRPTVTFPITGGAAQ